MNSHPTSTSFPNGAICNRTELDVRAARAASPLRLGKEMIEVINRGAGRCGFSDDDLSAEYAAQKIVRKAVEDFKAAIEAANDLSCLTYIRPSTFDDFVHDNLTDEKTWDERISDARRG